MASSEGTNSQTNSHTNQATGSNQTDDDIHPTELKGWLMKRSKLTKKWKKQWFLLRNTNLVYGNTAEDADKNIPLTNAEIANSSVDRKSYAFSIKSKENGRTYYMHAETEASQNDWMQAVCFAKAAGQKGDNSQACILQ